MQKGCVYWLEVYWSSCIMFVFFSRSSSIFFFSLSLSCYVYLFTFRAPRWGLDRCNLFPSAPGRISPSSHSDLRSYLPPQAKGGGSAQCLLLTSRCRLIQTACKGLPAAYKLKVITAPWPSVPQFQFLKCIGIKSVTYHLQNKIQVFFFLNSRNVNFYYYLFVHLFIFI